MKKEGKSNFVKKLYNNVKILKNRKYDKKEKLSTNIKKISIIVSICLVILSTISYFTIINYSVIKSGFKTTSESILKILTVDEKRII